MTELTIDAMPGEPVSLNISVPALEYIAPVSVSLKFDATCPPGHSLKQTEQGNRVCVSCAEGDYERDGECFACGKGLACPTAGLSFGDVHLLPGYWRADSASIDVRHCRFGKVSCPGNLGNGAAYCAPSYTGPLCSECVANYFISWEGTGDCVECAEKKHHAPTIVLLSSILLFAGVLVACIRSTWCRNRIFNQRIYAFSSNVKDTYSRANFKMFTLFLTAQVRVSWTLQRRRWKCRGGRTTTVMATIGSARREREKGVVR